MKRWHSNKHTHNLSAHRSLSLKKDSYAVRDKRTKANSNYKMRSQFQWQIYTREWRRNHSRMSIQRLKFFLSGNFRPKHPHLLKFFFCTDYFRIREWNKINIRMNFCLVSTSFVFTYCSVDAKIFDKIFLDLQ